MTDKTPPKPPPLDTVISDLLTRLNTREVCCERHSNSSCLGELHGKMHRGRLKLWYGSDCKAASLLCDACLAYWHVAVARNLLLLLERKKQLLAAEPTPERTP